MASLVTEDRLFRLDDLMGWWCFTGKLTLKTGEEITGIDVMAIGFKRLGLDLLSLGSEREIFIPWWEIESMELHPYWEKGWDPCRCLDDAP